MATVVASDGFSANFVYLLSFIRRLLLAQIRSALAHVSGQGPSVRGTRFHEVNLSYESSWRVVQLECWHWPSHLAHHWFWHYWRQFVLAPLRHNGPLSYHLVTHFPHLFSLGCLQAIHFFIHLAEFVIRADHFVFQIVLKDVHIFHLGYIFNHQAERVFFGCFRRGRDKAASWSSITQRLGSFVVILFVRTY